MSDLKPPTGKSHKEFLQLVVQLGRGIGTNPQLTIMANVAQEMLDAKIYDMATWALRQDVRWSGK